MRSSFVRPVVPRRSASPRAVVTGGAGFFGSAICLRLARHGWDVVAVDDLSRSGSTLNVPRLAAEGVCFARGDVRDPATIDALPTPDALVVAAAESSVLAGAHGSPTKVLSTNLEGAINCFELARRTGCQIVLISTSRVYPADTLARVSLVERAVRFDLADDQVVAGVSSHGISEALPLQGIRTMYGASKLAAELLLAEYANNYGIHTVIDRFSVLTGPWQMGRAEQGVFAHWVMSHTFGWPLRYIGYGGTGKQVRDLLHVDDATALILQQVSEPSRWSGGTYNVGGGRDRSLSLLEATALCQEITGRTVPVERYSLGRPGDVPVLIADTAALEKVTTWRPQRQPAEALEDIFRWARAHEADLAATLAAGRKS